jgi:hypothetical protein
MTLDEVLVRPLPEFDNPVARMGPQPDLDPADPHSTQPDACAVLVEIAYALSCGTSYPRWVKAKGTQRSGTGLGLGAKGQGSEEQRYTGVDTA